MKNEKIRLYLMDRCTWGNIILVLALTILNALPLYAQGTSVWSEPQRLNMWDSDNNPDFPDLVADPFGRLHVVTVRNYADANASGLIYYSRLDDQGWSPPIDILAAPNRNSSRVERFVAGENGRLFLLWSELNNGLFWSYSTSLDAASANAWNTHLLVPGATLGDFVLNGDEIDFIFVDNNRDIFFRRSTDGGDTWQPDVPVWSVTSNNQAIFTVRLAKDKDDILHIAWTETDAILNWNPSAVWYARSLDGGQTWQDLLQIPDEGSYINIGFDALGNIHLLWNHNVGSEDGRYHAISADGGQSWGEPQWIFPGLSGRTGFPQMILDSAGNLHQFTSGRGMGLEGGVYHSLWLGDRWEDPTLISKAVPEDNNEGPTVAITSGNLLQVVWRNNFQIHDSLYAYSSVDTPEQPLLPLPAAPIVATVVSSPTLVAQSTPLPPMPTEPSVTNLRSSEEQSFEIPPTFQIWIGILPALFLVIVAILWNWRKMRG